MPCVASVNHSRIRKSSVVDADLTLALIVLSKRQRRRGLPAALSRLLNAYTMVFWVEFRVLVADFRANSQIASLAILQTIALPTELPRRDAHSIGDSWLRSRIEQSNGLED